MRHTPWKEVGVHGQDSGRYWRDKGSVNELWRSQTGSAANTWLGLTNSSCAATVSSSRDPA